MMKDEDRTYSNKLLKQIHSSIIEESPTRLMNKVVQDDVYNNRRQSE